MQGFATAEPERVREASGELPRVFLLADHGWNSYSTVLETRDDLIQKKPEMVQRFVNASILGWRAYLAGKDTAAADALIKKDNRAMTDGQIAYSRKQMNDLGLVDGGEAKNLGVGAMSGDRVAAFYDDMVKTGMYDADEIDPRDAVTTEFVNKRVGAQ